MLVSKKRLYKELCRVLNVIEHVTDYAYSIETKHENDIVDVKERINYTLQKIVELTERIEKLETKRSYHKKETKKIKGK